MNNLFNIKDYVVVITGGTGVLGRSIAKYLALEGAKVIIGGRKEDVGAQIVSDITAAGGACEFVKMDVMNQQQIQEVCDYIVGKYGKVDTLLNAAGGNQAGATIGPDQNFFDLSTEAFQQVLNLNLTGTVIPTQIFLKPMVKAGKGSIINFSSMAAFRPMTRVCGYAAAKAGISNFTAYMAHECAKKFGEGIRVNAIAPGFIFTKLSDRYSPHDLAGFRHKIPVGHGGTVDDITPMILFLSDIEKSKFIVGETVFIDGGQSIDGTIESIEYNLPND